MTSSNKETKTLTILVFILVGFGLLLLSSAGVIEGQKKFGSALYYFWHQLTAGALLGGLAYFVFSKINYKFWKKVALPFLLVALSFMMAIFVPQLGLAAKGATRWLDVGLFSFQPGEILKLAMILYLAAWFGGRSYKEKVWSYSLIPFLVVFFFAALLLVLQPDMGTLGIVTIITLSIFFFAGGKTSFFLSLAGVILVGFFSMAIFSHYQFNRLLAFINRAGDPQGISYHINQALLAIGRGGWWGVGFGRSEQKSGFLPEPVGDSIFAILVEELGLIGAGALITVFLLLIFHLVRIAKNTPDRFAQLFVMGVAVWIASQAFINIAAITGLVPLTGIPLPFISYGGTSLAVLLGSLGIVASIAKQQS
ncbi:MAG: putative peptidoglycan glycosyltransferase FtsW [bacterium]|nr:putative peptidoglycan glycosyltransferase FtsW [bacterium]